MASHEFKLPDVGEGLAEGEIVRWHVEEGTRVRADQIMVEVETDKAIVEIPSPVDGVLTNQGAKEGDSLAVGAVLAVFETTEAVSEAIPTAAQPDEPQVAATPRSNKNTRVKASPAVRKAARERGIDLQKITGSGARGQITHADLDRPVSVVSQQQPVVRTAVRREQRPSGADRVEPLKGLRKRIAQTMEQAWREVPHIFNACDVDATQLIQARAALNAEYAEHAEHAEQRSRISYLPFMIKACVVALQEHPNFNASIDTTEEQIVYRHRYNIGIATSTRDGLLVPVIHDAEHMSLLELSDTIATLAQSARDRKARPDQLTGGTFTISNFGSYGGGFGMPIIRPPEVAIAGFGQIREQAVAVDGRVVVKPILPVVVSTDHRLNDGEHLGAFVSTLTTYLREPFRLLGRT